MLFINIAMGRPLLDKALPRLGLSDEAFMCLVITVLSSQILSRPACPAIVRFFYRVVTRVHSQGQRLNKIMSDFKKS